MFFVGNFHDTLNSDVLVKASFYKHFKTSTQRKQPSRHRRTGHYIFKEGDVLTEVVSCACAVSLVGGSILSHSKNQSHPGNPLQHGIII